jgi:hypothetical protein
MLDIQAGALHVFSKATAIFEFPKALNLNFQKLLFEMSLAGIAAAARKPFPCRWIFQIPPLDPFLLKYQRIATITITATLNAEALGLTIGTQFWRLAHSFFSS